MACLQFLFISVVLFLFPSVYAAEDIPQSFTLDGRLFETGSEDPLEDSGSIIVQILNPTQDCVLYEETQTFNTIGKAGNFSLRIGSAMGSGTRSGADRNNSLVRVFSNTNSTAIDGKLASNGTTNCSYSATQGAHRRIRIKVIPSDMQLRVLAPDMWVDSVPNAMVAESAETLQGVAADQFAQLGAGSLTQTTLNNIFSNTNYPKLTGLLSGSSADYVTVNGNGATLPGLASEPVGANVGQIWYDTSDNVLKYKDHTAVIKTVSSGTYALPTTGTAGTYTKVTTDAEGRVTSGTTLAETDIPTLSTAGKVSGSAINTGTITGNTVISTTGAIGTSSSVSARVFDIYDSDNTNYVRLQTPATGDLTANYTLTLPTDAGVSGQYLSTNGSGTLTWAAPPQCNSNEKLQVTAGPAIVWSCVTDENSGGDIAGITTGATSGLSGGATSGTPVLQVEVDGSTIEINGSNDLQVKDGGITNAKINSVEVGKITSAAGTDFFKYTPGGAECANGGVLKWNNTLDQWECGTDIDTNTDAVSTVHGRSGAVVSANGDYTASQITNAATGTIAANTVQAAIDELGTEKVAKVGDTLTGNLQFNAQTGTRYADADSDFHATIRAPATIPANYVLTLPDTDGNSGEVLSTDGSGNLSWVSAAVGDITGVTTSATSGLSGGAASGTPVLQVEVDGSTIEINGSNDLQVKDGGITNAKINTVEVGKITSAAGTDFFKYTPGGAECANGGVLKWNNTLDQWECGTDNDTIATGDVTEVTTAAGSGLTGGATSGAIALALDFGTGADQVQKNSDIYQNCAPGQKLEMNPGPTYSWVCTANATLADTDGDTRIQTEESADEDTIRFDTAGTERMVIDSSGLSLEGTAALREVAAPAATADYGKIYVKTDSRLYFKDDSGAEFDLLSGSSAGDILGITTGASSGLSGGATSGTPVLQVEVDGSTIEINGSNDLQVKDGGITDAKINTVGVGKITSAAGTDFFKYTPGGAECANGGVLKWNNTLDQWECGTDIDTNTDAVSTVHGRSGAVVSANGDYTASQVTNAATGTIAANTVQAAIDELGTEKVAKVGDTLTGNLQFNAQTGTRYADADSDFYATIRAPATIPANYVLTLPDTDGNSGEVLSTDGSGNLSWVSAAVGDITGVTTGASSGLSGGAASGTPVLQVEVDGSTIEINGSNDLQVKDGGITNAKINTVEVGKITSAAGTDFFKYTPGGAECANGGVLKWNNTLDQWECGTDNDTISTGDVTEVTTAAGSGLTGGATLGAIALALDFGTGADQVQKNSAIYSACGAGQKFVMNPGPTYSWVCTNIAALQDADNDTKIQVEESADEDKIRFDIAGTQRMVLDSTGYLGLNQGTPKEALDIAGGHLFHVGGNLIHYYNSYWDDTDSREEFSGYAGGSKYAGAITFDPSTGTMRFQSSSAAGAEGASVGFANNLAITSNGRVGMGTTTPTEKLDVVGNIRASYITAWEEGATVYPGAMVSATTTGGQSEFILRRARGVSTSAELPVQDGDVLGILKGRAYNGTQNEDAAAIRFVVDDEDATGSGLHPGGAIHLNTRGTTSTSQFDSGTPRLTVRNDGRIGVGTETPNELFTVEGITSLREVASSPSATTNYGKLYVKTDNRLYFTDDAGAEFDLLSGSSAGDILGITTGAASGLSGGATSGTPVLQVEVDNTTIEINGSNDLQVKDGGITNAKIAAVAVGKITSAGGTDYFKYTPGGAECANGGVLKWNNTLDQWECGTDNDTVATGDVTEVTTAAGSGLTGGATSGAIALSLDFGTGADQVQKNSSIYSACGVGQKFVMNPGPTYSWVCTNIAALQDADNDTKIQVEEAADEDKIRFDTAGTERMVIDNSGNVGIGTTTPTGRLEVRSNPSNATTYNVNSVMYSVATTSGAFATAGFQSTSSIKVLTGQTNSGTQYGAAYHALRNWATTDDRGHVSGNLAGLVSAYGHYGSDATSSPTTDVAIGLKLEPYYRSGTVATMYDIYISPDQNAGGVATTHYGFFQANYSTNVFRGNVGIGTETPNQLLTVEGPMSLKESAAPVATADYGKIYVKTDNKLYFMNDAGVETDLLAATTGGSLSSVASITGSGALPITAGGANQNLTLAGSGTGQVRSTSVMHVTNNTASTSATSGSLVVDGGVGIAGAAHIGTSITVPLIYGSSSASGDLTIQSTSDATKGDIILAPTGGFVGIGTTSPYDILTVQGNTTTYNSGAGTWATTRTAGYSDDSFPQFVNLRARGTAGTPAYVQTEDALGGLSFRSWDSPGRSTGSEIRSYAIENHSATAAGSDLRFYVQPLGTENTPTERMRITPGGNISIGGSGTPFYKLEVAGTDFDVRTRIWNDDSTAARYPGFMVQNHMGTANVGHPEILMSNSRGSGGAPTAVQTGDWLGNITFAGEKDTSWGLNYGARIVATAAETFANGAGGGNLAFQTAANGTDTLTERMRILHNGNMGIGTATPGSGTRLRVNGQVASSSIANGASGAIDWSGGNAATTSFDCGTDITFENMRDGGSYTLAVTGTGTTTCNFDTAVTGDDAATVSYRFKPSNGARTGTSHTIYSFQRIGNIVYVSWITGF